MRASIGILPGVLAILLATWNGVPAGAAPQAEARTAAPPTQASTVREFTKQYCISCHNGRLKTAGLELGSA